MGFNGKVCLVTGGARGIGKATVWAFAKAGADVALCDLDLSEAKAVAHEVQASTGRRTLALLGDVSKKRDVERIVQRVLGKLDRVDVLVNNAGIWRDTFLAEMAEEDWDAVFAVNVKGVFLCSQAVAKVMMRQRSGSVISIASLAGKGRGSETWGAYSASKAAVIMLTRVLASELKPYGIQVNALCPGATDTDMLGTIISTQGGDYSHAARPEAVAEAVVLLASEEAGGITGEDLDGPPRVDAEALRRHLRRLRRRA